MKVSKLFTKNGITAIVGYLLSPLSWWNDVYINIPIAYVLAIPFSHLHKNGFSIAIVFFYWVTNIVGFIMMHSSAQQMLSNTENKKDRKKELIKDLFISLLYTVLIAALVQLDILKSPF